jgi:hypothetical protein
MRIMFIIAVAAAALCGSNASRAAVVFPWCAVVSFGTGDVYWDCQYRTFEECVPNVLAGNRGFCNHNPGYVGEPVPAHRYKVHQKRRVYRD